MSQFSERGEKCICQRYLRNEISRRDSPDGEQLVRLSYCRYGFLGLGADISLTSYVWELLITATGRGPLGQTHCACLLPVLSIRGNVDFQNVTCTQKKINFFFSILYYPYPDLLLIIIIKIQPYSPCIQKRVMKCLIQSQCNVKCICVFLKQIGFVTLRQAIWRSFTRTSQGVRPSRHIAPPNSMISKHGLQRTSRSTLFRTRVTEEGRSQNIAGPCSGAIVTNLRIHEK